MTSTNANLNNQSELQAVIAELEQQRNWALTRCTQITVEYSKVVLELSILKSTIPIASNSTDNTPVDAVDLSKS